jgi:hypothetical protein
MEVRQLVHDADACRLLADRTQARPAVAAAHCCLIHLGELQAAIGRYLATTEGDDRRVRYRRGEAQVCQRAVGAARERGGRRRRPLPPARPARQRPGRRRRAHDAQLGRGAHGADFGLRRSCVNRPVQARRPFRYFNPSDATPVCATPSARSGALLTRGAASPRRGAWHDRDVHERMSMMSAMREVVKGRLSLGTTGGVAQS